MIQVEKHGNQYGWYRATCPKCGCEFVFSCNDFQEKIRYGHVERTVQCPECVEEIECWEVVGPRDDEYWERMRGNG